MRDIKYRGKCKNTGEWVYGVYLECYDKSYILPHDRTTHSEYIMNEQDMVTEKWLMVTRKWLEIIPETVGQYTEKKDKNDMEIYEDDILRGYQYPYLSDGAYNYYAEVVWFDNCPSFGTYCFRAPNAKVRGASEGNAEHMEDWESSDWEIIGNLHDNPELTSE